MCFQGVDPALHASGRLKALTPEVYYSISSEVCVFLNGRQRRGTLGLAAAMGRKMKSTLRLLNQFEQQQLLGWGQISASPPARPCTICHQ